MHGCIKDDSGELLKHALKKSVAFLSGAFLMELSPYISLCPIPHRLPSHFLLLPDKRKYSKYTVACTYCADELVYTVLRHTVHMCEVLSKLGVWEFNLAQRALDSLKESKGKGEKYRRERSVNLKVAQITQGNARASNLLCPAVHSVFTYSYLNNLKVCQLLTCWFSFCWCVLGRLVKMVFSISAHPDDGRLTEGTDSFFSPSSTLFFSKSKN